MTSNQSNRPGVAKTAALVPPPLTKLVAIDSTATRSLNAGLTTDRMTSVESKLDNGTAKT